MPSQAVFQSSFLASFSYDEKSQSLDIQFLDGKSHRYFLVPTEHYAAMQNDECPGCYFKDYIQEQYNHELIESA